MQRYINLCCRAPKRSSKISPYCTVFGRTEEIPGHLESCQQSIWHGKQKRNMDRSKSSQRKEKICITDAKDNYQTAANNLSELIGKISTLHESMQLDITTGSMSGTTAAAVYETLLNGLVFVIDYFSYIEKPELLDKIIMSQLCDKLIEGFSENSLKECKVKT